MRGVFMRVEAAAVQSLRQLSARVRKEPCGAAYIKEAEVRLRRCSVKLPPVRGVGGHGTGRDEARRRAGRGARRHLMRVPPPYVMR